MVFSKSQTKISMKPRIVIIGFGSIGQRHLEVCRETNPEADIRIVSKHLKYIPKLATGLLHDIEELHDFLPEVGIICSTADSHLYYADILAGINCHMLIEKPISISNLGVKELIHKCHSNNIILSVGYNLRFFDSLVRLKQIRDSGIIGKVCLVNAIVGQSLPSWRPGRDYKSTASAIKKLGGGVLLELSHEIDYFFWLFGSPEKIIAISENLSKLEIDVEDYAHIALKYSDGMLATLQLDFFRKNNTRTCELIGEKGSLKWNALDNSIHLSTDNLGLWEKIFVSKQTMRDTYFRQWESFLDSIYKIKSTKIYIDSNNDAYRVIQLIDAARKSAVMSKAINFPEL